MPVVRQARSSRTGKRVAGKWVADLRPWGLGRKRITAPNKAAAEALASKLAHDVERAREGLAPLEVNPAGWTLGDLVAWELEAMPERSRRGARGFLRPRVLDVPRLAGLRLEHVTTTTLEAEAARLEAEGLSPRTVNKLRTLLSAAFARAKAQGRWHGDNPATAVGKRREPETSPDVLTVEEAEALCRWWWENGGARRRWRGPFLAFGAFGGLRKGELVDLEVSSVDLANRLIHVRRSKSGKARTLPITAPLFPWAKIALEELGRSTSVVFESRRGGASAHHDPDAAAWVAQGLEALGIRKRLTFHGLRHTAITIWAEAGVDLRAAQKWAGHSDVRVTVRIYQHVSSEWERREALKVGAQADVVPLRVVGGGDD